MRRIVAIAGISAIAGLAIVLPFPALPQGLAPPKVDVIHVDPAPDLAGSCHPTRVRFNARIHATGPVLVTYRWERSDGHHEDRTLTFDRAQTHYFSTDWDFTRSYSGWMRLVILKPKRQETEKIHFAVHCG